MLGAYFVVGFPRASSMAQATVPLCSQPYASTPMVCPANFFRLQGLWIDLRSGNRPSIVSNIQGGGK